MLVQSAPATGIDLRLHLATTESRRLELGPRRDTVLVDERQELPLRLRHLWSIARFRSAASYTIHSPP